LKLGKYLSLENIGAYKVLKLRKYWSPKDIGA